MPRVFPLRAREETRESRRMPCLFLNTESGKPPQKSGFRRHLAGSKMPKETGWIYLRELVHILLHLGLVLWPLTWGIITNLSLRALAWATAIIAVLCGLCLWHQGELPQPLGPILAWNELGMGRDLIAGSIPDPSWLVCGQGLVLAISLSGAIVLVAALIK